MFNNGFAAAQVRGSAGFMSQNGPVGQQQGQQLKGFHAENNMVFGRGATNQNHSGASNDQGQVWQQQRGRGRGRGGRFQGGRGGRESQLPGGRGRGGQRAPSGLVTASENANDAAKQKVTAPLIRNDTDRLKHATMLNTNFEQGQSSGEANTSQDENIAMGAEADKEENKSDAGKNKKKEKWCFRCCSKGHSKADCKVELFCVICESEEHMAPKCPTKKKQRPMAYAVGYAVDDLGFTIYPMDQFRLQRKMETLLYSG